MSDIDMTSTQAATHDSTRPLEAESSLGELLSRLTQKLVTLMFFGCDAVEFAVPFTVVVTPLELT